MYLKSRGRNIIIHEAPRPEGMGWPGAAMMASQQPSEIPDPMAALRALAPPSSSSTPSWGALAAQASGNPLKALATQPGTTLASGASFADRLFAAPAQAIQTASKGSLMPLVLIGGTGLLALLLLKKKR